MYATAGHVWLDKSRSTVTQEMPLSQCTIAPETEAMTVDMNTKIK